MNKMFGHLHNFCVVYLDDILIFNRTPEEHKQHLETVLHILEKEGLYAKLKKCEFNFDAIPAQIMSWTYSEQGWHQS